MQNSNVASIYQKISAAGSIALIVSLLGTLYYAPRSLKQAHVLASAQICDEEFARLNLRGEREERALFASLLLDTLRRSSVDLASDDWPHLERLENVAHLTRRGVIDFDVVWNHFGVYVRNYVKALHGFDHQTNLIEIGRRASQMETLYSEIEWLDHEIGVRHPRDLPPTDSIARSFLRGEIRSARR